MNASQQFAHSTEEKKENILSNVTNRLSTTYVDSIGSRNNYFNSVDNPVSLTEYQNLSRISTEYPVGDIALDPFTGIHHIVTEYGTIKITSSKNNDIIRKVEMTMEKRMIAYKYYSSIWFICAIFACFFITSGVSGLLGPLSASTGGIFSLVGGVGAFIDWKGWQKRNDSSNYN